MPSMVHIIGIVSSISPLPLVDAAISIAKAARNSWIQTGKFLLANATSVRAFWRMFLPGGETLGMSSRLRSAECRINTSA